MPAQVFSREARIYLALWRKALQSDELVRINCSSRNMAISMRQGMYRAVRPFRLGQMSDEELRTAAEKFVVFLSPKADTNAYLELRPRVTLSELEGMFDTLGIDEEDLRIGDERSAEASIRKLMETEQDKPRATPFYERE